MGKMTVRQIGKHRDWKVEREAYLQRQLDMADDMYQQRDVWFW